MRASDLELWFALDALVTRLPRDASRDDGAVERIWDDCLLDQLAQAAIESGESGGGSSGKPKSKPPVPMNVLALNVEIQTYTARFLNGHDMPAVPDLANRLRAVVGYIVDHGLGTMATVWHDLLCDWASRIRDLSGVERPRSRALPIPCVRCGQRWISALDPDGQMVRRDIMSAVFEGGKVLSLDCAECGTWSRGVELDALVEYVMTA